MANYEQPIAHASSAIPRPYSSRPRSAHLLADLCPRDEEPEMHYIPLDTTQPISIIVAQIVEEFLQMTRNLSANQESCDGTENHVCMSVIVL